MTSESCLLSIERRATGMCFGCNSASQITRAVQSCHDTFRIVSLETEGIHFECESATFGQQQASVV